jgi:hypothetical protein
VPTLGEVRKQIVLADNSNHGTQEWGGLDFTGFPYNAAGSATTTLTLQDGQPGTFLVQNIYDDNNGVSFRGQEGYAIQNNIGGAAVNMDPHKWFITGTNRAKRPEARARTNGPKAGSTRSARIAHKPTDHSSGIPALRRPAKTVPSYKARTFGAPQYPPTALRRVMLDQRSSPASLRASASSTAAGPISPLRA